MSPCLEIEECGLKYWHLIGNLQAESIGKDADNVSTDDPKNEFDAWDNKS